MALSAKHINWLDFGTFGGSCLFICGFSYEEVLENFKRKKTPIDWVDSFQSTKDLWMNDNWGFCAKRIMTNDCTYFFLVLKSRFDFKDDSHARLAHEILHLATFQLKDILDPVAENECFAYSHTYLMNQCYKILRN